MDTIYQTKLYQKYRNAIIMLLDLVIVFSSYVFTFFMDNNFFLDGRLLHITHLIIYGMIFVLVLHLGVGMLFPPRRRFGRIQGRKT